jgi:hypothetical protein
MFATNTPARLVGVAGQQVREKDERRRVIVLAFQLQPFTVAMADDLNIKGRLFSSLDGEPLKDVISTKLAIGVPKQRVEIRLAPDQEVPSVELYAAVIKPAITIRKDREGPVYSATFYVVSDYPSGDNLLLLMQRVTEQFFVTLTPEQGDMLDTAEGRQPALVDDKQQSLDVH